MDLLRLAWINIVRDRRRSLPVATSIILGVVSIHLALGYILATFDGLKFSVIYGGVGHLRIARIEQFENFGENVLRYGLTADEQRRVSELARTYEPVALLTRRAAVQGLVSTGELTHTFSGIGLEADQENGYLRAVNPIVNGVGLNQSADAANRIVLGQLLGKQLAAAPGNFVTLLAATETGGINAIDGDVVGWVSTGVPETDAVTMNVPLELAQDLLQTDKVSKMVLYLRDESRLSEALAYFRAGLPDHIAVKPWRELAVFHRQLSSLYQTQFTVFGAIIGLAVFISLFGAVMTSVLERTYQMGVLQAIGISRTAIRSVFLYETVMLGAAGTIIGLLASAVAVFAIDEAHIMLPPPPGRNVDVPLRLYWSASGAGAIFLSTLAICSAAAFLASRRVMKMRVIDAIKRG